MRLISLHTQDSTTLRCILNKEELKGSRRRMRRGIGGRDVVSGKHGLCDRYNKLHYTTLHYTTLHNTTLHHMTPQKSALLPQERRSERCEGVGQ